MIDYKAINRSLCEETKSLGWNVRDDLKGKSIEDIRTTQRQGSFPYWVCCLNLSGDLNIANIIRSSCVFGVGRVIVFGRRIYDKRGTVGAENYIPVNRIDGFDSNEKLDRNKFDEIMEENCLYPVFIEQGGIFLDEFIESTNRVLKVNTNKIPVRVEMPCFVFGSETNGIDPDFIRPEDKIVEIPQYGVLRSLNVSNAAAIVMYEISKKLAKNR